jgi:hypothetical protein
VERATATAQESPRLDETSSTGFKDGTRELIVPEHNYKSYNWIAQTQQMIAQGQWRVRHIDYENAPFGREVGDASPYRWWLGILGWFDHHLSGRPVGAATERMALYADPVLHLLLLVGTVFFVRWKFGGFAAGLVAVGLVGSFPFGGGFLPGAPSDDGVAQALGLWSVLLLLTGIASVPDGREQPKEDSTPDSRFGPSGWFFIAGVVAGLGSWISVSAETPVLFGITLGALTFNCVAVFSGKSGTRLPWRTWALGISGTIFVTYLLEYFPGNLGEWNLRSVHPVFGLGWLGMGEILTQLENSVHGKKPFWKLRPILLATFGILAISALPIAVWLSSTPGFLAADLSSHRLTNLPDGAIATSLGAWLIRDGFTGKVWSTLVVLLPILPATWILVHRETRILQRMMVSIALGTVVVVLSLAVSRLSWWNNLDVVSLALLISITVATADAGRKIYYRWAWAVYMAVVVGLGVFQLVPPTATGTLNTFTQQEVEGLIDRDLSHWLSKHTGTTGAVVLATPKETAALHYYANMKGLGTLDLENREGLGAVVRIVSATTPEEAFQMVERRGVKYFVVPSWDSNLDELAVLGLGQIEGSFIYRLHHWALPNWLRPVAYQMPKINGFENQSVLVFEVVENQSDPTSLSRIAEYFVEMGQLDQAAAVAEALKRFPADLGAQAARLNVELASNVTPEFGQSINLLVSRLARKADRSMLWDRRVSLAIVLARGKQIELSQKQIRQCLSELDESKLRGLTTGSLYRLLVLTKAFGLEIADPRLRELATSLIPVELREQISVP